MEPPLQFLREAYRGDESVPGHDDTVTRLFDRYIDELDAPAPARPTSARGRAAHLVRAVRRRLHR